MPKFFKYLLPLCGATLLLLSACQKSSAPKDEKVGKQERVAPVTVVQATTKTLEMWQEAIGQVDPQSVPQVTAEVAGRIQTVMLDAGDTVKVGQTLAQLDNTDQRLQVAAAEADLRRLQGQVESQERTLQRLELLVKDQYVPRTQVDDARTLLETLREQQESASVQLAQARRSLEKTRIAAPVSGQIQARLVSVGDYVNVGKPLFQLVAKSAVRVHLPFPESLATQLRVGQKVLLTSPVAPDRPRRAAVSEIKPMIGSSNRSLDVIVDLSEAVDWPSGASVNGRVVTDVRENVLTLPEASLVQRPAGTLVYVVQQGKAVARLVETGLRQDGVAEIIKGLSAADVVVLDGAGFLTDGAKVQVKSSEGSAK